MGLFGCAHKYGNWGKKRYGYRHRTCTKCHKTQRRRVGWLGRKLCLHRMRKDRRVKSMTLLRCKKCGKTREILDWSSVLQLAAEN